MATATAPKNKTKERVDPVAAATAAMTEDLRNEIPNLKKKLDQLTDYSIDIRHEIGELLVEIIDDKTGKYGTKPEDALFKVMPLSADSLRPMILFARNYNKVEMKKLRDMRNPVTEERLTWTHIIALSRVPNKDKAFTLAEKAITHRWSTKALNKEVAKANGGKKSNGGRKPKTAKSFAECLADIEATTLLYTNRLSMWLTTLPATFNSTVSPEATNATLMKVDDFAMKVRQLAMQLSAHKAQAMAAQQKARKLAS